MISKALLPSLFVASLSCLLWACQGSTRDTGATKVKYKTQVMKPESRVYNVYIPASLHGITEVDVYPRVEGIIREVNFTDGIEVKKGQTLFVIDQTEHKHNVMNAQANLAAAKEDLLKAQITEIENRNDGIQALINLYTALGGF